MRNPTKIKRQARVRRHQRVRAKIFGTAERPRLSVFRSGRHFVAQLIDDTVGKTVASASDYVRGDKKGAKKEKHKTKTEWAAALGEALADAAKKIGVTKAVFDRGGFRYHGRIRAFADAARKSGLEF